MNLMETKQELFLTLQCLVAWVDYNIKDTWGGLDEIMCSCDEALAKAKGET